MLDTAFEALKKMDYGTDLADVAPIEDAAVAAHDKADLRADLEKRLIAALQGELSRDAQDYVCRKLTMVGSAAAVPVLATLVVKKDNSHMARFALEQIPVPEASMALRDALSQVQGGLKIGVMSSLGARRDVAAVPQLASALNDKDPAVARSAALALGAIGSPESAKALSASFKSSGTKPVGLIDALLHCGESLVASGKQAEAQALYEALAADTQPRLVRLAATRGLLACYGKQA